MTTLGIAIGTFGDIETWAPLAQRAIKSVGETSGCYRHWEHGTTLSVARNLAAHALIDDGCEWIMFLDADDELAPGFVEVMYERLDDYGPSSWPVIRPSTQGVIDGVEEAVYFGPSRPILQQNFMPIGCVHRAELFKEIDGFDGWPVLEDWAYWCKAWLAGAVFVDEPRAVYRIHEETGRERRNFGNIETHNGVAMAIRNQYTKQAKEMGRI